MSKKYFHISIFENFDIVIISYIIKLFNRKIAYFNLDKSKKVLFVNVNEIFYLLIEIIIINCEKKQ